MKTKSRSTKKAAPLSQFKLYKHNGFGGLAYQSENTDEPFVLAEGSYATPQEFLQAVYIGAVGASMGFNQRSRTFKEAYIDGEFQFQQMVLERASFRGAYVAHADFDNANLSRADFSGAHFYQCTFRGADLSMVNTDTKTRFSNCNLLGANLYEVDFEGVVFWKTKGVITCGQPDSWTGYGWLKEGYLSIRMGCSERRIEDALQYWHDKFDRREVLAAVHYIQSVAKARGWPTTVAEREARALLGEDAPEILK